MKNDSRFFLSFFIFIFICLAVRLSAEEMVVRKEARLLETPENEALILDILSPGIVVEVVSSQDNWARVRVPATTEMGWVQKGFLAEGISDITGKAAQDIRPNELDRLQTRVKVMSQGMAGIEQRVETCLGEMQARGYIPAPVTAAIQYPVQPAQKVTQTEGKIQRENGLSPDFKWNNRFFMGKYIRGGEDFFGFSAGRILDSKGWLMLDAEIQYALGDNKGKRDDFVNWAVGTQFNIKPSYYRVYPFISAYYGRRHILASPVAYQTLSSGFGIKAELGSFISLSARARELFLFKEGGRTQETALLVSFNCSY